MLSHDLSHTLLLKQFQFNTLFALPDAVVLRHIVPVEIYQNPVHPAVDNYKDHNHLLLQSQTFQNIHFP